MQAENQRRIALSDNGNFSYHVSLSPVVSPVGGYALMISSRLKTARKPNEEHVKFLACLEPENLRALGELIQQTLEMRTQGGAA